MKNYYPALKNPTTGEVVHVKRGFSWPAFLITPIWCLIKGLWLQAIIFLLIGITGIGLIAWIIAGVKGNEWYYEALTKRGYKRVEE